MLSLVGLPTPVSSRRSSGSRTAEVCFGYFLSTASPCPISLRSRPCAPMADFSSPTIPPFYLFVLGGSVRSALSLFLCWGLCFLESPSPGFPAFPPRPSPGAIRFRLARATDSLTPPILCEEIETRPFSLSFVSCLFTRTRPRTFGASAPR